MVLHYLLFLLRLSQVKDTIGEAPGQLPAQYSDKAATR